MLLRYLANLSRGRLILWCYFIWYCVVLVRYFDPSPRLWLTSFGLSIIIGCALYLSTTAADKNQVQLDFWKTFRLFLMPFFVSSFAAMVKGKGFVLIFSPNLSEIFIAIAACLLLCSLVFILKRRSHRTPAPPAASPQSSLSLKGMTPFVPLPAKCSCSKNIPAQFQKFRAVPLPWTFHANLQHPLNPPGDAAS